MNIKEITGLHNAISHPELRIKPLSIDQMVDLLSLKEKLQAHLDKVIALEEEVAKAYNVKVIGDKYTSDNEEFLGKIKDAQAIPIDKIPMNFLDTETFKVFVEEMNANTALILLKYLKK